MLRKGSLSPQSSPTRVKRRGGHYCQNDVLIILSGTRRLPGFLSNMGVSRVPTEWGRCRFCCLEGTCPQAHFVRHKLAVLYLQRFLSSPHLCWGFRPSSRVSWALPPTMGTRSACNSHLRASAHPACSPGNRHRSPAPLLPSAPRHSLTRGSMNFPSYMLKRLDRALHPSPTSAPGKE